MKICRLEEVECEFSDVGCVDRFRREDKEPHTTKNSHKHLILTASLAVQTREDFQEELQKQDNKHKAEEQKLKQKIEEQEKVIREQQQKLNEAEKKLMEHKKLIYDLDEKLLEQLHQQKEEKQKLTEKMEELTRKLSEIEENKIKNVQVQLDQLVAEEKRQKHQEEGLEREQKEQERKLQELCGIHAADKLKFTQQLEDQGEKLESKSLHMEQQTNINLQTLEQKFLELLKVNEAKWLELSSMIVLKRTVQMKNFSAERAKDLPGDWKSPAMYTHLGGYKFCVGVDANGRGTVRGLGVCLSLFAMPGEFDDVLDWPAKAKFTVELFHPFNDIKYSLSIELKTWNKPSKQYECFSNCNRICISGSFGNFAFVQHSNLKIIVEDTLHIRCLPVLGHA